MHFQVTFSDVFPKLIETLILYAAWDDKEVETTRRRILMMIYPEWEIKLEMGTTESWFGTNHRSGKGLCTENVIMRLVFHDCIPYTDGTGGCDGCMNWHGMDSETPNPNDESHKYKFEPVNSTDNKVLSYLLHASKVMS